jgi:hypothetical protein
LMSGIGGITTAMRVSYVNATQLTMTGPAAAGAGKMSNVNPPAPLDPVTTNAVMATGPGNSAGVASMVS